MTRFVFFDLDGTVADTLADLANAVNFALKEGGISPYPVEDYRYFVGNGVDNLIKTTLSEHYSPELAEKTKRLFRDYYADHCLDCTRAYPGMSDLLLRLSKEGVTTAVISNKPDRFVPQILSALYPEHHFALMWGQQEGVPRKPAPDALNQAMELLNAPPDEVLYVGDSNVDVRFAHAAGVKVCGAAWGFRGKEELLAEGADFIANDAKELYRIIMRN
ncbi:MAG: HAD-IA family hydrolase [Ruminococcus sp.]|nr:HAD-IA family hydrolase [Ruminococcus sp.]